MNRYLFDNPQGVMQAEFESDLQQLPTWRREQALRFHFLVDRVLCTKAYLLLKRGLQEHYGIEGNPTFSYIRHDKPILKEYPHIHFNMSHCKHGVLCVIDNQPIGCDIEEIQGELDINLVRHCFNTQEEQQILTATNPCVEFTKLWTIKEAVLKLTGEGINNHLPILLTPEIKSSISLNSHICQSKGYVYTTCQYKS